MKRTLLLILALLLGFSAVACSADADVPDGMQAAYLQGEPFRLYVPEQWKVNTGSGISGAVYFGPDEVVVNARYYTPEDAEMSVESYLLDCAKGYALTLENYETESIEAAVLGGADAQKLTFTMKIGDLAYTGYQVCAKHQGDMVSLQIYLPTSYVDQLSEAVSSIISTFVLCDKAEESFAEVTDKKTPEGMKIATHDEMEYRLYVPKTWICDAQSDKSEAYYPESGRSNVSVTSYSPEGVMTAEEYWEECQKEYKKNLSGFTVISTEAATVANKDAVSAIYEATYDGVTFRIRQVSFVYREMVYTLTYTALVDNFDLHMEDVDRMLSEFHFR